jgi:ribonuclease PH
MIIRADGRSANDLREVFFATGFQKHADGSVLVTFGNTKVICAANVETNVPYHAKQEGTGWLTAEYSMLPGSTSPRAQRETKGPKGRSQEIQRLIGRALRSVVDVKAFPERSILIDCDVLQADGGTRTASITGGYLALALAVKKAQKDGRLPHNQILNGQVAAVSCGVVKDEILVDLCYEEDSTCDVDCNVVLRSDGKLVEIQGTAERNACSWDVWNEMVQRSTRGIEVILKKQREILDRIS